MKVLVLEDDDNLRELLCETLEDEGYQAEGAESGAQAIQRVTQTVFDLMVVDVRMEGMTGLETFAYLRQQGQQLACLVITGYATEEDSIRAIRLGVGDYLRKPFDLHDFLLRLARLAAFHQRRREAEEREELLQHEFQTWLLHQASAEQLQYLQFARQLTRSLQLSPLQDLQCQAGLLHVLNQAHPTKVSSEVSNILNYWQENWNGSGPLGLEAEAIPLEARLVRLVLLGTRFSGRPQELLARYSGVLDPHLTSELASERTPGQEARARRLLALGRGMLAAGETLQARLTLEQAEGQAQGPLLGEVHLLLALQEPFPIRMQRLKDLVRLAKDWGPAQEHRFLIQAGLMLMTDPPSALPFLQQSLAGMEKHASGPERALAGLALWAAAEQPDPAPMWTAMEVLLEAAHEPDLYPHLHWFAPRFFQRLVPEELVDSQILTRFLRHCGPALWEALAQLEPDLQQRWMARLKSLPGLPGNSSLPSAQDSSNNALPDRPPPLHVRSLGAFTVYQGGKPILDKAYRGNVNRMLLAFICSQRRPVSEERIRETFWPDSQERGRKALYNGIFYCRKALRQAENAGSLDYFSRSQDLIGLNAELEPWHDLWEVEELMSQLETQAWPDLKSGLQRLSVLYQGPYLEGCFLDWAIDKRGSLELRLSQLLERGCQLAAEAEDWGALADWSWQLLRMDELCPEWAVYHLQGLCRSHLHQKALSYFQAFSSRWQEELATEIPLELVEWGTRARYGC